MASFLQQNSSTGGYKRCRRVWIDCDTGIDDAHALLAAVRATESQSESMELIGVSCVAGNMNVDVSVRNTELVLDVAAAAANIAVYRGAEGGIVEPVHFCPEIHGEDGLGNLAESVAANTKCKRHRRVVKPAATRTASTTNSATSTTTSADGATAGRASASSEHDEKEEVNGIVDMVRLLMACPDVVADDETTGVTIIALAPLTNVALALRVEPRLKNKVRRIMFMGGAATIGGNATPWAEANMRDDPEAAHIVLESGLPLLMFGWDVYVSLNFTEDEIERLEKSEHEWARLSAQLMRFDLKNFGGSTAMIGDGGTVLCALRPEWVHTKAVHVAMELNGTHTRGMTVVDLRPIIVEPDQPRGNLNVHVVTSLDVKNMKALFLDLLTEGK